MSPWRPILSGSEADRAIAIAEEIAEAVVAPLPDERPDPFRILLDTYLALAQGSARHAQRALAAQEALAEHLTDSSTALYGGLAGIGWLTEHLSRLLAPWVAPQQEDLCAELEAALVSAIAEGGPHQSYDLVSGMIGAGVFALERVERDSARELLGMIVDRLHADAERMEPGLSWLTPAEQLPDALRTLAPSGFYNLGMAHGVPGIVSWLAHTLRHGVRVERSRELLEGAVPWILACRTDTGFCPWIPRGGEGAASTWDAWCYGGLGLSVALLGAARRVGIEPWAQAALDIACFETTRVASEAFDLCLCHGAAGNAHLYNRLFQATGEASFGDAARRWLRRTLEAHGPNEGLGGYLFPRTVQPDTARSWRPAAGFLTGSAGVGLALLAAATDLEPGWDRLLLADL